MFENKSSPFSAIKRPTIERTTSTENRPSSFASSRPSSLTANRPSSLTANKPASTESRPSAFSATRQASAENKTSSFNVHRPTPIALKSFEMTEADFNKIRALIYRHAGIVLTPAKREMVYGRLVKRLRDLSITSFDKYVELIERNRNDELENFINALTTNLTAFFREAHHFPILAKHISTMRESHSINIWCSAASTGEEPYSLAMTAAEVCGLINPGVSITATDLDTTVLATARAGVYSTSDVLKLPVDKVKQYFRPDPLKPNSHMRVRDELKQMISFSKLNLLDPTWKVPGSLDAIFCRNVLIYFDRPTQRKILERFSPLLRPDGLLFVGHSESLYHSTDLFKPIGNTVYKKAG